MAGLSPVGRLIGRGRTFAVRVSLMLGLAFAPSLTAQTAALGGVVIDAGTGDPISGVEIRVDGDLVAVTDDGGAFRLAGISYGSRRFIFRHIAYGEHERSLELEEGSPLQYEIRMSREAIELSPLVVDLAPSYRERVFRGGGNPGNVIDADAIEAADRTGMTLMSLLLREVQGIRIRGGNCIEYRFQGFETPSSQNCREMAVFMDGIRMQESPGLLLSTTLAQLERVEVLSPGQAGARYGDAAGRGVILLETKQGVTPELDPDRINLTGFGWHDEQPYRWPGVLGVSFVTHAAAAALTFGVLIDCGEEDVGFAGQGTCNATFATGAGLLTGTLGGLLTGWAGRSSLTEGRMFPLMLVGAASATTSFLLFTRSDMGALDADDVPGLVLASAATSLLMTLTDRIFRVTR